MSEPKKDAKADPRPYWSSSRKTVKMLDLRFTDLPGLWHHVSYPIDQLTEESFEEGFGMDGSSIRGWAAIHESDMLLIPDPATLPARSVHRSADAGDDLRRDRSGHQAALRPRSALHRQEGGDVSRLRPASPIPPTSAPKRSSSSSTTCASISASSTATTSSTPRKAAGIPAARKTIWATARATRKAISRFRPPIITRTCAPRWC